MADRDLKPRENVPGRFYVDETCVDCNACPRTAPGNFKRCDAGGYSYVAKQPETEEEWKSCVEAMQGCPTESIGDDGDANGAEASMPLAEKTSEG